MKASPRETSKGWHIVEVSSVDNENFSLYGVFVLSRAT